MPVIPVNGVKISKQISCVSKNIQRSVLKNESPLKNLNSGGGVLNQSYGPDNVMVVPGGIDFKEKAYFYLTGGKLPKSLTSRWQDVSQEGIQVHPNDDVVNFSHLSYTDTGDAVQTGSEYLGLSSESKGIFDKIVEFFTDGDAL